MKKKLRQVLTTSFLTLCLAGTIYANPEEGKEAPMPTSPSIHTVSPIQTQPGSGNKQDLGGTPEDQKPLADPSSKEPDENRVSKPDETEKGENPKAVEVASSQPTPSEEAKAPGQSRQANPVPAPGSQEDPSPANPDPGQGQASDPKGEDKKDKPQVDPKEDKDLRDLQGKIEAQQDKGKKAELQKQYNDKLFKAIEESGADKLNKEVLDRFTDEGRTKEFYQIQAEYEELKKKAKEGKLTQEEVNAFNKKVGSFKPPRKLDEDEKPAQEALNNSVEVTRLNEGASEEAKETLKAYNDAKDALKKALDLEKVRGTKPEELQKLLEDFKKAEAALKKGIDKGDIKPAYTKNPGVPEVRVFPLVNGSLGKELNREDNTYYIPDNTGINLLVHVNKDEEPKDFTFKIKAIGEGVDDPNGQASNLAFLNGTPVDLVKNNDGSYSFTVSSANMNFGIAQLRFNIPGFEGPFHKGFDLVMDLGNGNTVTKQFRITKKGYEDEAHLNGPGSDSADDPTKIPEVDAGDTENAKVKKDSAKEVLDFFTYLKKSNTYIDDVTFNSGNGESLPLDSVDITITVPKHDKKFAEMIHKSGLEYHKLEDGKYQLKLDRKVFGGNLVKKGDKLYLTDKNGNKTEQELTAANLKDVILENAGKKVYVDNEKNAHEIITSEVLADKNGSYKVENGKLYKKNDEDQNKFDEIGTFDKDGKIEKDGKIYVLKDNKLTSYTKEHDVYDGNVVNKKDKDGNYKADPNVTPTYKGKQVTIVTEVEKDGEKTTETSYGGTIVKDAIYDKNGKIFNEEDYKGQPGDQVIDSSGKKVTVTQPTEGIKEVKDSNGKLLYKYFVGDDKKTYRIVKDAVFKGDYIVDGLEYKKGLSLIDKFGKKMDIEVSGNATEGYTFTRKVKDKEGNESEDKVKSGENTEKKRNVIVGTDESQILVNSKNEVVNDPDGKYKKIGPKYYYDGKEFVEAKGDGLKANKFFVGFTKLQLDPIVKHYYKVGDKTSEITDFDKKSIYEGSLDPKDYFKVDDKIYVKKSQGEYYVSADPEKSDDILSEKKIAKIVQTLGEGEKAIEKVTDETDIFDAVQKAKFALKFPGFLAGKNVVYNLHADVKATYKKPKAGQEGEFENVNVFTKDGIKKIDKFFTLKNEKETNTSFFKHAPKELKADPAVNLHFFNIFYRNADDRQRDKLIVDLLAKEDDLKKAEDKVNDAKSDKAKKEAQDAVDKFKKENKEELALIAKFKEELKRLYNNATFYVVKDNNGKKTLVIKDKDGNVISADELNKMRSLLWEIGFKNEEGTLFPKNSDTEIIIEDHNMDNRLIYDEIIVNDTRENWDKLNKAHEDAKKQVAEAEKALEENKDESQKAELEATLKEAKKALEGAKFKGTKDYFFLDQIKDIRFGVNPNYINGRFVPLGKDFKITGQEIIKKLKDIPNAKSVEIEKGEGENKIKFLVTRDTANGQIRIKVMNAFYAKAKEDSDNKFYSPAQKAYQKKIDDLWTSVEGLELNSNEEAIKGIVEKLHADGSDCFDVIKEKLTKELDEIKNDTELNDIQKNEKFNKFKKNLKKEIKKLQLTYLDSKKGDYKYDDMRFNAIRIGLNPGITIGGAMNPENTKKIGISSVIIPEIDIPYTDEFGELLTNKDKYVYEAIEKIKAEKKSGENIEGLEDVEIFDKEGKEIWKSNEDSFRKVMAKAYKIVNDKIDSKKIGIKTLVELKDDKYTAKNGSDLKLGDLAVDGKVLTNKEGFAINPWYIVKGDETKSVKDIFKAKFGEGKFEKMPEYLKLEKMPIDIAAYYMSKQGYDRNKYANQANYKLSGGDKKDGIFGSDSDWHKKICYPGLGHCIEQAGKDSKSGENPNQGKFGAEEEKGADFELTYEPTNKGPDKENPKTDKSSTAPEAGIDITGEEDKKVDDFTIKVTVDKMTKEQKDIADALTPEKPEKPKKPEDQMTDEEKKAAEEEKKAAEADKKAKEIEAGNYKDNGYYEYKNSLIIDFLPKIFKLKQGETTLTFTPDKKELMANGANAGFKDEKTFENWKKGIKYFYTDDLEAYAKTLTDKEKAEVLKKAIEDAKASGKIKDGQKVQAVLAWLPNFEAPHGSENQFTFKLSNVFVDKKKFKDFEDKVIGTNYTNHAAFGDKARFYFGKTTVNIHENPKGKVNKYLQLLDKDGSVIDKDKAKGWFKGNAELKFGDKFNYRIEYHNNTGVVAVPGEANNKSEIKLEDLFASVTEKGLRPVLNGYITSDFEFEHQVKVIYKVDKEEYTKGQLEKAIEANKVKFSDVTSVVLEGKYANGATHNFYIPMMVPELDAKIKDGKVVYIGTDGKEHELGDADKFFNLKSLVDPSAEMAFENKVKDSNTVTVYLEKNRFIRLFKEFFDANGEEIKKDRPEMKFDIYQYQTDKNGNPIKDENGNIIKVKVLDKDGKPLQLVVNEKNNFTDMKSNLPLFKKTISFGKDGKAIETVTNYKYELVENDASGYDVKFEVLDNGEDQLGFVIKAKNTEKPERPPHNPPEEPKTPPEEPGKPPETPGEKPKYPQDIPGDTPGKPRKPRTPNNLPKTGLVEDLGLVYLSGLALAGLVLLRKKYFLD